MTAPPPKSVRSVRSSEFGSTQFGGFSEHHVTCHPFAVAIDEEQPNADQGAAERADPWDNNHQDDEIGAIGATKVDPVKCCGKEQAAGRE